MTDRSRSLRSLYERRFRRPVDDDGEELLLGNTGEPVVVTQRGRFIGFRKRNGGIFRPPVRPIEEAPSSDEEWVWTGRR